MNIIIDTGPLVAYLDDRDQYHHWVTEQMLELEPPFYTCEAVITEAVFLLQRADIRMMYLFELMKRGDIVIEPVFNTKKAQKRIRTLVINYANLPASFADACLVQMATLFRKARIFTLDSDFNVYRGPAGDGLSLVFPQ